MEQHEIHGDNQQERLLWWLGGIIDGEGCITINHSRLHTGTRRETLLFSPILNITNTNKVIIDKCVELLSSLGIAHHVSFANTDKLAAWNKKWNRNFKRNKWDIKVQGLKRCVRALNLLQPYIIGKAEEVQLVKQFCESRLSKAGAFNTSEARNRAGQKWGGNAPYNDQDFLIIERVADIHNRNPQRLHAEIRAYKERNKI